MKKPTSTVVDQSKPNPLAPPASLGEAGRKLWHDLHRDFVLEDSGAHTMLLEICSSMDNLAEYDEEIGRDGVTIRTKSGVREHPLLKHRLATQSFVVRSLHRLAWTSSQPATSSGGPRDPTEVNEHGNHHPPQARVAYFNRTLQAQRTVDRRDSVRSARPQRVRRRHRHRSHGVHH